MVLLGAMVRVGPLHDGFQLTKELAPFMVLFRRQFHSIISLLQVLHHFPQHVVLLWA